MSLVLTYNCQSDDAILTGGSWAGSLPLANLQTEDIAKVARSTDAALASTQFKVDLGAQKTLKTFLAGPSNLEATFQYRVRSWADAAFSVLEHDGGWVLPLGGVPSAELDWSDDHYWLGIAEHDDPRRGIWVIHVFETPVRAQYWTLEINDTGNPDGYVQFGRLFLGDFWVPSTGQQVAGNAFGFRDASMSSTTLSGSKHYYRRTNPRFFRFGFDHLPEAEAFRRGVRFSRVSGFDREVHIIPDPDDTINMQVRSFLGTVGQMDPLALVVWKRAATGYEIEEII